MSLLGALFLLAVSYSRDVAPIFALHCNSCHGDAETAGGLEIRTYAGLMKSGAIVPGDPDGSQIVQFIEGRRGEEHRMPLGGVPLTAEQIARIRRWIAEGAREDAGVRHAPKLAIAKIRVRRTDPLRIECRVPVAAYLVLDVVAAGRILYERRASVKSPKDRGDAAVPGELVSWTIWPERGWPATVAIELSIRYAEGELRGASLTVASGREVLKDRIGP